MRSAAWNLPAALVEIVTASRLRQKLLRLQVWPKFQSEQPLQSTRLFRAASNNLDLENQRPPFPGDKQPVVLRVICNSVQNRFGIVLLVCRQQAREIDP